MFARLKKFFSSWPLFPKDTIMHNETCSKNHRIEEVLTSYIENSSSEYAILLKGSWGCGKTFFIKSFMERYQTKNSSPDNNKEDEPHYCYISLFDIKELAEIDRNILAQTSPFFNSDKSKNVGRLASTAFDSLKALIPYGELIQSAAEGATNYIKNFITIPKNIILVLDDIERSSLPIHDILGYCHTFLTVNRAKIILLADEEKLVSSKSINDDPNISNEQKYSYADFKEKIIGKTLIVQSDPKLVYTTIVDKFKNIYAQSVMRCHESIILNLYKEEGYSNLRVLQYFLYESEEFIGRIENNENANNVIIDRILIYLFHMVFMKNVYSITSGDIFSAMMRIVDNINNKDIVSNEKQRKARDFYNKFGEIEFHWKKYLQDEYNYNEIIEYYISKDELEKKNYELNFNVYNLNNDEINKIINRREEGISNKKYTSARDIMLLTNSELYLSEIGIVSKTKNEICGAMEGYIKNINIDYADFTVFGKKIYGFQEVGRRSDGTKDEYLSRVEQVLIETMNKKYDDLNLQLAKDFLASLEDEAIFSKFLEENTKYDSSFEFYTIDPSQFLERILPCSRKKDILYHLNKHCKGYEHTQEDCPTCKWWQDFHTLFTNLDTKNSDYIILKALCEYADIGEHRNPFKLDE